MADNNNNKAPMFATAAALMAKNKSINIDMAPLVDAPGKYRIAGDNFKALDELMTMAGAKARRVGDGLWDIKHRGSVDSLMVKLMQSCADTGIHIQSVTKTTCPVEDI